MVQPHSGAGKGFYFIPEIGEEVMVGFEGGNADKPYVIGTHYNGTQSSGYATADNSFKVIKTQTGHYLEFEELKGIKLADKKGNIFHIDSTADTLNIEALQTINLKAPNINLIATQNITTNAGMNISETAGVDKTTTVGIMHNVFVGGDSELKVKGKLTETIEGDIQTHTKEGMIMNSQKDVAYNTEGEITKHSNSSVQVNSTEKSKFF
jgi:uncharacterized protein involved in type VI secretion and phage assembly